MKTMTDFVASGNKNKYIIRKRFNWRREKDKDDVMIT